MTSSVYPLIRFAEGNPLTNPLQGTNYGNARRTRR